MGIKSCESGVLKELVDSSDGSSNSILKPFFIPDENGTSRYRGYAEDTGSSRHIVEELDNPTANDESYITNVRITGGRIPETGYMIFLGSTTHDVIRHTVLQNIPTGRITISCVPNTTIPNSTNIYTPSITILDAELFWYYYEMYQSTGVIFYIQISPNSRVELRNDGFHINKLFFPSYMTTETSSTLTIIHKRTPFAIFHLDI